MNADTQTGYLLLGAEIGLIAVILDPNIDSSTKGTAIGALVGVLAGKISSGTPSGAIPASKA